MPPPQPAVMSARCFLITVAHLLTIPGAIADNRAYENAEDLSAADILPGDLLKGQHHTVDDRMRNDGFLNYYTIKSHYGVCLRNVDRRPSTDPRNMNGTAEGLVVTDLVHALGQHSRPNNKKN